MSPAGSRLESALRDAGFRGEIRLQEPLGPFTTWRIGGPAEILVTPSDPDDLVRSLRWGAGAGVPWRILGNGSNLLVRDEGVSGLVIRLRKVLDDVLVEGTRIRAGAGAAFPAVANLAAKQGLAGIEFGAGIPGTIGGAVIMNAGWHEFEIGNAIASVDVVAPSGDVRTFPREACGFGYRRSAFRGKPVVVLSAVLALRPDDPEAVAKRLETFAGSRKLNQPTELPSCGSVFLKPPDDFAGRLIEEAGLKGYRVGDIQVSPKHANFFVNLGRGRARDALALVEHVEREVERQFGVRLEREFEVW